MENVNQKINDCYFYFYSTCKKGDSCAFRHCELALGTEDICENWRRGQCAGVDCALRHMENQKKRVTIPCYWENQPGGCRKPHCVFKHYKNNEQTDVINKSKLILPLMSTDGENIITGDNSPNDASTPVFEVVEDEDSDLEPVTLPTVEPLVVNFDEESDSGSCGSTPGKKSVDVNDYNIDRKQTATKRNFTNLDLGIKTLAEIRREKNVEFESEPTLPSLMDVNLEEDLRARLTKRLIKPRRNNNNELDFKIKTLDEIRGERKDVKEIKDTEVEISKSSPESDKNTTTKRSTRRVSREIYQPRSSNPTKIQRSKRGSDDFGIKSLSEIREERRRREEDEVEKLKIRQEENEEKDLNNEMESCDESKIENSPQKREIEVENLEQPTRKKLKLNIIKTAEIVQSEKVEKLSEKSVEIEGKMDVVESTTSVEEDLDFLLGSEDGGSMTSEVKEEDLLLELEDIINS